MPALGPILRLSPSGSQSSDDITAWLFTAAVRPHQEVKRCALHLLSWEPYPQGEAGPCCTLKRKCCELKCEFRPEDLCDLLIYYVPKRHRKCGLAGTVGGWDRACQRLPQNTAGQQDCRAAPSLGEWPASRPKGQGGSTTQGFYSFPHKYTR